MKFGEGQAKKPKRSSVDHPPAKKAKLSILSDDLKYRLCNPFKTPEGYDVDDTFDWATFLDEDDFGTPSVQTFPHGPLQNVFHHMQKGLKVEVPNLDYKRAVVKGGVYWIASVVRIAGYKLLVRYEGLKNADHDFWVNICTDCVRPIGWCAHNNAPIIPPKCVQDARPEWREAPDWKSFLSGRLTGARTLPMDFNDIVASSLQTDVQRGMRVEVNDKGKLSQVRPAVVLEVIAKRLRIVYGEDVQVALADDEQRKREESEEGEEGEPENEFWCHMASPLVHPVGWAISVGHEIECSASYRKSSKEKREKGTYDASDATPEMFPQHQHSDEEATFNFSPGQKLEARDPLNLSQIAVATVSKVLKRGYMMVSFDGYPGTFCYHQSSSYIFPVGFCRENDIDLIPPKGTNATTFNWPNYLKQTKSVMAPTEFFNTDVVPHGFREGDKLESTDLMSPSLVCAATVAMVKGRLLRIHFDGWDDDFDQWIDCNAPDLFPVGWGEAVGYKVEAPKEDEKKKPIQRASKSTGGSAPGKRKKAEKSMSNVDELLSRAESAVSSNNPTHGSGEPMDSSSPAHLSEDDSVQSAPTSKTPTPSVTPVPSANLNAASPAPSSGSASGPLTATVPLQQQQMTVVRAPPAPMVSTPVPDESLLFPADLRNIPVQSWTVEQVVLFLKENDVDSIIPTINKQEMNGKKLVELNMDGLTGPPLHLKINTALKMKSILKALQAFL